jgi:hypothetical protein
MTTRPTLRERTYDLLRTRSFQTSVGKICRETGLSRGFVEDFSRGRTKDPSADRVQVLYEYLSGRQLEY